LAGVALFKNVLVDVDEKVLKKEKSK
jgi:hypothetical protein